MYKKTIVLFTIVLIMINIKAHNLVEEFSIEMIVRESLISSLVYNDSIDSFSNNQRQEPKTITHKIGDVEIDMIEVKGGVFSMGSNEKFTNEKPEHNVKVDDFQIGKFEITQAQWEAVMNSNPSCFKGDNLPVEQVNWNKVQEFIRKLNGLSDKEFRLPTEAEWEYAAVGGIYSQDVMQTTYSGSNTISDVSWCGNGEIISTQSVGGKLPNQLGIFDMSGNVWEWCSDWFSENYYSGSPISNPLGASVGTDRVLRGGGSSACRVTFRGSNPPDKSNQFIGFRLVFSNKNTVCKSENVKVIQEFKDYVSVVATKSVDMVAVKGGSFKMGSRKSKIEKPVHEVLVDDFYIGRFEVTQDLWKAVIGDFSNKFRGADLPMVAVSWNDIQVFIKKLNKITGVKYRLPTEAEWEYAAKGGIHNDRKSSFKYSGCNSIDNVAWYWRNSGRYFLFEDWEPFSIITNRGRVRPVKGKKPNLLGIYDMSGNVWEWCNDRFSTKYYKHSPINNPKGPLTGKQRVSRGGSWYDLAKNCRVTNRKGNHVDDRTFILGFRLACSVE